MDTFTFDFTFEPEIDGFFVSSFDCRATVEVSSDGRGEDWHIDAIELCGVKYERPTAGDLKAKRTERHFPVAESHTYYADMLALAEKLAPDEICEAWDRGEIGPAAAAATRADYYNDLAKEAAE
jgi:hypothetical protein